MKVMSGRSRLGFGSVLLLAVIGAAALALASADDIRRYLRIRNM